MLPDDAGIVQPITDAERDASRAFLGWVDEVLDWGRVNADRAETARKAC